MLRKKTGSRNPKPKPACFVGRHIAVDYFHHQTKPQLRLFFLTHGHMDHCSGLANRSFKFPIYCSPLTAKILPALIPDIDVSLLRPLEVNEQHQLEIPGLDQTFSVTVLDANHCPGAVMFFFEGSFGNVLCTGDFRYDSTMQQWFNQNHLYRRLREIEIDELYLDNTYYKRGENFPSRSDAQAEVLDIIKCHPDYQVLIGMRKLGKEELLCELAKALQMFISVSSDQLRVLEAIESADVFTVDPSETNVHAVPIHTLKQRLREANAKNDKLIAILPSAVPLLADEWKNFVSDYRNAHWVLYSDHSSRKEIIEFLKTLTIKKLTPIAERMTYSDKFIYLDLPGCDIPSSDEEEKEQKTDAFKTEHEDTITSNCGSEPPPTPEKAKLQQPTAAESPKRPKLESAPKSPEKIQSADDSLITDNELKFMSMFCKAVKSSRF